MPERFLLDTSFVQALLNKHDQDYRKALSLLPRLRVAEVWITEAVLIEVGDALSRLDRPAAVQFIRDCYHAANMNVVAVDRQLLDRAVDLYSRRSDKTWGLTDCISFVVMQDHGLTDAMTADHHFVQAGFRVLLLEG